MNGSYTEIELFSSHISKHCPDIKLPLNITKKMAKQLASIRQVAGIKKANFLAIPVRAELRSVRVANDKVLEPYSMSFVNIKAHKGSLGNKIWMLSLPFTSM